MLLESTTRARSADASARWPRGCSAPQPLTLVPTSKAELLSKDDVRRVERALQHVYRVVLPAILRQTNPGWGPGPLSSERSWEFFVSLAEELGEWAWRLAQQQDITGASVRRIERAHREDAAGELVTLVRRMSPPIREVVEARAVGVGWKRMTTQRPERAYFSMVDDYRRAVATLHFHHDDVIRRLT